MSPSPTPLPSRRRLRRQAGIVALCLLAALAALPAQASCPAEDSHSTTGPAQDFLALAAESVPFPALADEVLDLHALARCGDADAIAALQHHATQADTALLAIGALADAGHLHVVEPIRALSKATLPPQRKAQLLALAGEWLAGTGAQVSARDMVQHTAWAVDSGHDELARIGQVLRATHGDTAALAVRREQLLRCARHTHDNCLDPHERHTAPLAQIEPFWEQATIAQRYWLARWSKRVDENQQFLLTRLPHEAPDVQYRILTEALLGRETRELAIQGALVLLDHAIVDPAYRPIAAPLAFSQDHRKRFPHSLPYPPDGDYGSVLQLAFDELATYPDANVQMEHLARLDHPWLATEAGIWLARHGGEAKAMHALRFTLDDDGVPAASVLKRLLPYDDAVSATTHRLFLTTLAHGAPGKWNVFAGIPFENLLDDPHVIDLILARIARLPEWTTTANFDTRIDAGLPARVEAHPWLDAETRALEWAIAASPQELSAASRYLDALSAHDAPLWRMLALAAAQGIGDSERARALAWEFIDSPVPELRNGSLEILGAEASSR